jgi:hypothetical protein
MPTSQRKLLFSQKGKSFGNYTMQDITGRKEIGAKHRDFSRKIWYSDDGEIDVG